MAIFSHIDDDGDEISFFSDERSPLSVEVKPVGEQPYIGYLDRDAALRLHAALGEWLYPVHTPEGPNRSLIEQMIERAVRDQVAAVLPLHLKTVGEYVANYGRGPEAIRPRDWRPRTPGCECGHAANFHSEENGCCHWYTGDQEFCECTRGLGGLESDAFPDTDPEPHDVGHPTYEDARPHPTAPECGKCGALWSDTHGQPGDPCAPAPSAPAPAGPTWDDELWSAPSAEASARTLPVPACTKCGHSWPRHRLLGGPTTDCSVRGCECTRVRP